MRKPRFKQGLSTEDLVRGPVAQTFIAASFLTYGPSSETLSWAEEKEQLLSEFQRQQVLECTLGQFNVQVEQNTIWVRGTWGRKKSIGIYSTSQSCGTVRGGQPYPAVHPERVQYYQ